MPQTSITLRTESEFKEQCDALFSRFGISTIAAINMFLHQAVMEQAIPFKIEVKEDHLARTVSKLPEAGRLDSKTGLYVLPKEWDNPEDDIYDKLI
ncbi:addiction module antitoxin, RelB/DinJ family [methanogenic archaeon mixed culture ISO4-G1]|nr:addiction module antitoxin, RelB/DinJ family [methanogenic archaeon mixed culture ISO4-G1]